MGLLIMEKHSGCVQSQLLDVHSFSLEAFPMKDRELFITRKAVQLTLSPQGSIFLLLVGMSHSTNYVRSGRGRLRRPLAPVCRC